MVLALSPGSSGSKRRVGISNKILAPQLNCQRLEAEPPSTTQAESSAVTPIYSVDLLKPLRQLPAISKLDKVTAPLTTLRSF